jgi:uncharacterized protein (DUF924 family)
MKTPGEVLAFWFGEPPKDAEELKTKLRRWFGGGPTLDAEIKREFGAEIDAAVEGKLDAWLAEPKGWLALLVLLDQFTRNAYRGDPKTHAGDARAVKLTLDALEAGRLHALSIQERHFALMPLLHAEDSACQARYREEYAKLMKDVPEPLRHLYSSGQEQGEKYGEIIRRFGRFPHRNALLGRKSTPEEEEFLKDWSERAAPNAAREIGLGPKKSIRD